MANGYIGECVSSGKPALCTSADGSSWTIGANPKIIKTNSKLAFNGWSIAQAAAGWVAVGTVDPGTWFSSDGLNWNPVDLKLTGLRKAKVQPLGDGFAMQAWVWDGQSEVPQILLSTDGRKWTAIKPASQNSHLALGGAIGVIRQDLPADGIGNTTTSASADGVKWQTLELPPLIHDLATAIRLSSGEYLALGGFSGELAYLLRSSDGTHWTYASQPNRQATSLAQIGSEAVLVAPIPGTSRDAVWSTQDGVSWERLATLGVSLQATGVAAVGDQIGLTYGSRLAYRAIDAAATSSSPSAAASPIAQPTTVSTADQSVVIGGWIWHRLNRSPDSGVVKLPNGYLARCGEQMCTSVNGWDWRTPADPAIFDADPAVLFSPSSYGRLASGIALIWAVEGVWYSRDSVHWSLSETPQFDIPTGIVNIGHSATAFNITIYMPNPTNLATDVICHVYSSTDGASWLDLGKSGCIYGVSTADQSDGLAGEDWSGNGNGKWYFSADGRDWQLMKLPAGGTLDTTLTPAEGLAKMPDGTLIMATMMLGPLVRSTDGGSTWTAIPGGWGKNPDFLYNATAGGAYLTQDFVDNNGKGTMWESTDGGKSFHKWSGPVVGFLQFADLVRVDTDKGASWVGRPLRSGENPGAPTSAVFPNAPVTITTPEPAPPAGGLSKKEATAIVATYLHAPKRAVPDAAEATFGGSYTNVPGRWIWTIDFHRSIGDRNNWCEIDYFTGEVLVEDSGVE